MDFLKRYFKGDLVIWMAYFFLVLISIVCLYSASYQLTNHGASFRPIMKHIIMLGAGFIGMCILQHVPRYLVRGGGWFILFMSWVALIATLMVGHSGGDAQRSLSFAGINIQPSEFARLGLIIVMADLIFRFRKAPDKQKKFFFLLLIFFLATVLLIVTQALSTTILICCTFGLMLIYGGFSWKYILRLVAVTTVVVGILGFSCYMSAESGHYKQEYIASTNVVHASFLKATKRFETWFARIDHFSNEENKYQITDKNIQEGNAAVAIALGRRPAGPGNSRQRRYLPNADNDFIFAIIVEEWGIYGALVIMVLYIFLIVRCFRIAQKSDNEFDSVLVMGLSLIILLQALLHMAISVGIAPVTGQSLPLIGRGGSSIVIISAYLGLTIGVAERNKKNNELEEKQDDGSLYGEAVIASLESDNNE